MKKLMAIAIALITLCSCSNYYKAVTTNNPITTASIEDLKMKDKYFILRDGNKAFAMKSISLSADQKNLHCTLDSLPDEHKLHLTKGRNGKMKYKKATGGDSEDESILLNEVHVYIVPDSAAVTGPYTIVQEKLLKIEALEADKKKTNQSAALGIGITVTAIVLVLGAAGLLIASSALSFAL
jgi:hypothetical protein